MPSVGRIARRAVHTSRREDGQALVEFALLVPILLVILLGVIDVGKAFNYWNDETHLASEASRWAAVNRDPNAVPGCAGLSLSACIKNEGDTAELRSGATVSICAVGGNGVGLPVRATVSYPYTWMPFIAGKLGLGTSTAITVSSTMRQEVQGSWPACP